MGIYHKQLSQLDTLLRQADKLVERRFHPGFDGMTADGVRVWLRINGERFSREILSGVYRPMPASGFRVAKKSGKYRSLAKLTALDSVGIHCTGSQYKPSDHLSELAGIHTLRQQKTSGHSEQRHSSAERFLPSV